MPLSLSLFSNTGRLSGHEIKLFLISPSTSRVVRGFPADFKIFMIISKDSSSLSLRSLNLTTIYCDGFFQIRFSRELLHIAFYGKGSENVLACFDASFFSVYG